MARAPPLPLCFLSVNTSAPPFPTQGAWGDARARLPAGARHPHQALPYAPGSWARRVVRVDPGSPTDDSALSINSQSSRAASRGEQGKDIKTFLSLPSPSTTLLPLP